jgi:hypothetical protein
MEVRAVFPPPPHGDILESDNSNVASENRVEGACEGDGVGPVQVSRTSGAHSRTQRDRNDTLSDSQATAETSEGQLTVLVDQHLTNSLIDRSTTRPTECLCTLASSWHVDVKPSGTTPRRTHLGERSVICAHFTSCRGAGVMGQGSCAGGERRWRRLRASTSTSPSSAVVHSRVVHVLSLLAAVVTVDNVALADPLSSLDNPTCDGPTSEGNSITYVLERARTRTCA